MKQYQEQEKKRAKTVRSLAAVQKAAQQYQAMERSAVQARKRRDTRIVSARSHGASLREIGEYAGLSHSQIKKIVEAQVAS